VTGGWASVLDVLEEDEDDDDDGGGGGGGSGGNKEDGEKKSLKEKMQAMQEITLAVQKGLGMLAHVLESVGNVFNFSVPFISWLGFTVLFIVTTLLYWVPLRYILMLWGVNKFTKKLLRPKAVNNNELIDFISRVPDNEELVRNVTNGARGFCRFVRLQSTHFCY
jgi:hypothetical protein